MLCSALLLLSQSRFYAISTGCHFEPTHPYIGSTTILSNTVFPRIAKQTQQKKQQKQGVKNFLLKTFRCMDEPIKRMETRPIRKHTRRLPEYGNMLENKKTRSLPCICYIYEQQMQCSLRVFFFSTIFP